jgi:hypothetical protein
MKMNKQLVAFAVVAMTQGVFAVETPYDFVACSHGRRIALEASADIVSFGIESWGVVASSTTSFWEKASTHCVGYIRIVGGKPVGKGNCKWTEAGGDTAVGEWEYPTSGDPSWTWLTGVGKLKGISGGGTFRELFSAKPTDPATSAGCRRDWGKYSLP